MTKVRQKNEHNNTLRSNISANPKKVSKKSKKGTPKKAKKQPENGLSLDTLEQLGHFAKKGAVLKGSDKSRYKKRAKAKFLTKSYLFKLIDLDSPLLKSYWATYHCCETLIQNGQKITGSYCGHRWCLVCNRIRAAKMINGYSQPMAEMKDKHFVTLTIVSCKGEDLRETINKMLSNCSKIQNNIKRRLSKTNLRVIGIRKLEVTWNCYTNTFHPHLHLIVEGKEVAEMFLSDWLKKYPTSKRKAQNAKACNDGSMIEMFKYFTKIVSSTKEDSKRYTTAKALDTIFQAMRNKRVYQNFGGLKKVQVSEDVSGLKSEDLSEDYYTIREFWNWNGQDWITTEHNLCGYKPTKYDKEYGKLIKSSKQPKNEQLELF